MYLHQIHHLMSSYCIHSFDYLRWNLEQLKHGLLLFSSSFPGGPWTLVNFCMVHIPSHTCQFLVEGYECTFSQWQLHFDLFEPFGWQKSPLHYLTIIQCHICVRFNFTLAGASVRGIKSSIIASFTVLHWRMHSFLKACDTAPTPFVHFEQIHYYQTWNKYRQYNLLR